MQQMQLRIVVLVKYYSRECIRTLVHRSGVLQSKEDSSEADNGERAAPDGRNSYPLHANAAECAASDALLQYTYIFHTVQYTSLIYTYRNVLGWPTCSGACARIIGNESNA